MFFVYFSCLCLVISTCAVERLWIVSEWSVMCRD